MSKKKRERGSFQCPHPEGCTKQIRWSEERDGQFGPLKRYSHAGKIGTFVGSSDIKPEGVASRFHDPAGIEGSNLVYWS